MFGIILNLMGVSCFNLPFIKKSIIQKNEDEFLVREPNFNLSTFQFRRIDMCIYKKAIECDSPKCYARKEKLVLKPPHYWNKIKRVQKIRILHVIAAILHIMFNACNLRIYNTFSSCMRLKELW